MSEIASTTEQVSLVNDSGSTVPHLRLVPPPTVAAEVKSATIRRLTAEPLCEHLQWLLLSGDSAMGARGTLAGVISQIERGSVGGTGNLDEAGCYSHCYTDLQLGLGAKTGIGEVEQHRWLIAAWRELSPEMRGVLLVRYSAARAAHRSDSGYGARDKYIKVAEGASEAVAARTATGQIGGEGAIERERANAERRSREARHTGVEGFLGELAALAFALCPDTAKLSIACQEPEPQLHRKDGSTAVNKDGTVMINRGLQGERRKLRAEALKLARAADTEAHRCWFEAKAAAACARTLIERVGWRPSDEERAKNAQTVANANDVRGGISGTQTPRRRDFVKVGDADFGEAVRAALEASGRLVAPRGPRRVVAAPETRPEPSPVPHQAIDIEALKASLLAEQVATPVKTRGAGLLGLLNDHADEQDGGHL